MYSKLIKWSLDNFNELPWRKRRSMYHTLVSEIMLQQTTVSTVINHFDRFLKEYPTIFDLAKTTEEEICLSWKGLGYYRRARNLRKAAIEIVSDYDGVIPTDFTQLVKISGIGEYTASALISIGSDLPALSVDANLERVLSRLFLIQEDKGPKLIKKIRSLYEDKNELGKITKFSPRNMNEALMDVGRELCQSYKVNCESCPLSKTCQSFKLNTMLDYPVGQKKKIIVSKELNLLRVYSTNRGKVLAYKKNDKEWLSGQYELPTFIINSEDKKLKQYPNLSKYLENSDLFLEKNAKLKIKNSITKYKITNHIAEMKKSDFEKLFKKDSRFEYVKLSETHFSTASTKVIQKIKGREGM